jgi:hypothetical protein
MLVGKTCLRPNYYHFIFLSFFFRRTNFLSLLMNEEMTLPHMLGNFLTWEVIISFYEICKFRRTGNLISKKFVHLPAHCKFVQLGAPIKMHQNLDIKQCGNNILTKKSLSPTQFALHFNNQGNRTFQSDREIYAQQG